MISRAKEKRPLARFGATVATASDCSAVLVMGGIEGHIIGGVCLNDVWRFDVDSRTWECLPEPSWQPRRGSLPVVIGGAEGTRGCVVLVGGTGIDAKPLREVWKADAPRFRPVSWSQTTHEAAWPDAAYAMWVPDGTGEGSLLVFDSLGALWRSSDWGRSWQRLVDKLPFGWPLEQVSIVRYCNDALVAVTMSTRVWISQDGGVSWTRADGNRDPHHVARSDQVAAGVGPPGLRCQIIDVCDADAADMLVIARNRETCQLTLWRLCIQVTSSLQKLHASWRCLVPHIHIYPGFSSVNQLVSASRAAVHSCDGLEMRAVFVEFNPINEFTIWRASPVGVDRHRAMLDRLGSAQTKVDHWTWQKHIIGALLPSMGKDWVPRDLAVSVPTDGLPYQEENEWTYWH
ncbi:unnamed protein product [Symbiodinium pilosum]|uniref:Uncharacterized protein n=1 Tax=Symbiodinium pilosum TaxID=2952 RepID=A0A812MQG6_SYMPI|nr:unnamed protein product [Symbiodinium pilosum]